MQKFFHSKFLKVNVILYKFLFTCWIEIPCDDSLCGTHTKDGKLVYHGKCYGGVLTGGCGCFNGYVHGYNNKTGEADQFHCEGTPFI